MNKWSYFPGLLSIPILGLLLIHPYLKDAQAASLAGEKTLVLYDPVSGGIPSESLLDFTDFPPGAALPTYSGGATVLDTTLSGSDTYAGWVSGERITPDFPVLERAEEIRLTFTLQLEAEIHLKANRAGLSVILLDQDKTLRKKPGVDVEVIVSKEMPGYRIQPWKATFVMKLPKSGTVDTYALDADLVVTRYVTFTAKDKSGPVADAVVKASGKEIGKTDAQGVFVYEYKTLPKSGVDLTVTKSGYATWRKTGQLEPGQKLEVVLSKRVIVTISTLMEEYGQSSGIPGIAVNINNKEVGKTDSKGVFIYTPMPFRPRRSSNRSRWARAPTSRRRGWPTSAPSWKTF